MKRKTKKKIKMTFKEVLFDWKHWLGWVITTAIIFAILGLLGFSMLNRPILNPLAILITVAVVDFFKHLINLQ